MTVELLAGIIPVHHEWTGRSQSEPPSWNDTFRIGGAEVALDDDSEDESDDDDMDSSDPDDDDDMAVDWPDTDEDFDTFDEEDFDDDFDDDFEEEIEDEEFRESDGDLELESANDDDTYDLAD